MARNTENEAATGGNTSSQAAPAETAAAPAASTPSAGGGGQVMLTLDEQGAKDYGNGPDGNAVQSGYQVSQKDYILRRFSNNAKRGDIRKEVSRLRGKEIAFQVIFGATKGLTNSHHAPGQRGAAQAASDAAQPQGEAQPAVAEQAAAVTAE